MNQWAARLLVGMVMLAAGCGRLFGDRMPPASAPADVKRVTFEIVARDNRCEPSVLAADREGRAILITFQVTSVGKSHFFVIPDLGIRMTVPADTQLAIPLFADRSGIYQYGCPSSRWLGPFSSKGKLAIR